MKKIKTMTRGGPRLAEALAEQRGLLETRRAALDQAIGALAEIERTLASHRPIDATLLQRITDSMQPVSRANLKKRYRYQLAGKIERLKDNLGRARRYAELCREIEAAMNDDPTSPRAQELASRWMKLGVDPGFDPLLMATARGMFREAFESARDFKTSLPPMTNSAVAEFIQKAIAVRRDDASKLGGDRATTIPIAPTV